MSEASPPSSRFPSSAADFGICYDLAAMVELTGKPLLTEQDFKTVATGETVRIDEKAIVTPLAVDVARERQLRLERVVPLVHDRKAPRKIAMGADHGGYEMKLELKKLLSGLGYEILDLGTHSTAAVDYPDFAQAVALAVARGGLRSRNHDRRRGNRIVHVGKQDPRHPSRHVLRRGDRPKQPRAQWRKRPDAGWKDDLHGRHAAGRPGVAVDGADGGAS